MEKGGSGLYAQVIIDNEAKAVDRPFSYRIPEGMEVSIGDCVTVPFGTGNILKKAYVIDVTEKSDVSDGKLKSVREILFKSVFNKDGLKLITYLRDTYLSSYLDAIRLLIPRSMSHKVKNIIDLAKDKDEYIVRKKNYEDIYDYIEKKADEGYGLTRSDLSDMGFSLSSVNTLIKKGYLTVRKEWDLRYDRRKFVNLPEKKLTAVQEAALMRIRDGKETGYLLHGITGSGKTEVFLRAAGENLEAGHDTVILVPEIALTPQMIDRVKGRFGENVCVYHSGLNDGERFDEWMRVKEGRVKIAIGARSALFLPFKDLKLVVIDEEHESSYKSETNPKYQTRETAEFMMKEKGGKVILSSATPSLETYKKAEEGEYALIEMNERTGGGELPEVKIIDMRQELREGNRSPLSRELAERIEKNLKEGHQTILFMNRRGVSQFISCRECGYVYRCRNCSVSLTRHGKDTLLCHHCGYTEKFRGVCPNCGSRLIREFGAGTEMIEKEISCRFPDARVLRMDKDTTRFKGSFDRIYDAFQNHEADILIGTQMVAKGLDFPDVTLVGIVAADITLNIPDFRSYERTFQLITQASGRAGRADKKGCVILQTYEPDSYPVIASSKNDYRSFYMRESMVRSALSYPPYGKLMTLVLSSENREEAVEVMKKTASSVKEKLADYDKISVLGPVPCIISKLKTRYRFQLIIKGDLNPDLSKKIRDIIYDNAKGRDIRVSIDLNPTSII